MSINVKPVYKRILLKLSGEALFGSEAYNINMCIINQMIKEIKKLVNMNVQVSIVVGGGNLLRGSTLVKSGINKITSDHMGMLATIINGLVIRDALNHAFVNTKLMSAIPLNNICDIYNWTEAISLMCNKYVVILCAGTGNPCFTTDSAACLRGIEIKADIVLKATKVDGVFTADPNKDPLATMYNRLTYHEALEKKLKVMDLSAFILARDHKLPILVFNIHKLGSLCRLIMGEKEGTLITE